MRVTFNMMSRRVLDDIVGNSRALLEAQRKASSGKRIFQPSDDISGTGRSLQLRSTLSDLEQYITNADVVKSKLEVTSSTMDSMVKLVQRVRVIAVEAANTSVSEQSRSALLTELDEISASLVNAGNTQYAGKYIFSGALTDQKTLTPTGTPGTPYAYQGDSTLVSVQVSPWTTTTSNVLGSTVFNMGGAAAPGSPDIFSTIQSLKAEIQASDGQAISDRLRDIDTNLNNMIAIRSEVGSRIAGLESATDSLLDSKISLSSLLSKTEDADLAEAVLDLQIRENMYQAAVSTASRILSLSLTDYLK